MPHEAGGHRTLHAALSQPTPTIYRARGLAKVSQMFCNHSIDKFHFSSGISSDGVLGTATGDLANCSFLECAAIS